MSVFVLPADKSSKEEGVTEVTKEEHELGVVMLWVEVGASDACQRRSTEIIAGGISPLLGTCLIF